MRAYFTDLQVTDAIDILIATALVYSVVAWIRKTQAAHVAGGMIVIGAVYLAARAFEMQLTVWILQGFAAIFIIVVVVLFQEEFRQLFERVATFRVRRRERRSGVVGTTDVLVQCLSEFARDHTGALVVLPGSQPIGRHIQGGIELGGMLSLPLVKSIFDPHSPGHDGAMIIDDGRVSRFAAHLPLSKDYRQLAGFGTRHGAALGLAERCDALCAVVSEERGTVSVAHDGKLRTLDDPQRLGNLLDDFFAERTPAPKRGLALSRWVRGNGVEVAISFVFIIGLWFLLIPGSRPTRESLDVPVRVVNLPAHYVLDGINPARIRVTLKGVRRAFYLFDRGRVEITIDASTARTGRRIFELTDHSLRHPSDLSVEEFNPPTVRLSLRKEGGAVVGSGEPPAGG